LRALPYILIAISFYVTLFYLENYQPEMWNRMLLEVDVFGFSRAAQEEEARLDKIKNLTIPYEEKQVLIDKKVFMGATTEMVKLALDKPYKIVERPWEGKNITLTYYIYYLKTDTRPTVLVFEEDKLVYAYKGSALDAGN
jgi:hypothetical protein